VDEEVAMEPLELIEAFGEAWEKHDLDAALSFLSDDCIFDATGPAPDGDRFVGRGAIREAWRTIFDDASATFQREEVFAMGDRVIQLWRYSWNDGHVRGIDVFKVRGDRITEKLSYVKG
jgi:ketosteroid isomerase-like protein